MTARVFDVVVVGGGHNGLVCAAYLAAGGLTVCVLERRHVVGGAAVTEEFHPGFRNSTASYTVSLLHPRSCAISASPRTACASSSDRSRTSCRCRTADALVLGGGLAATAGGSRALLAARRRRAAGATTRCWSASARCCATCCWPRRPMLGGGLAARARRPQGGQAPARAATSPAARRARPLHASSAGDLLDRWFESAPIKAALGFDAIVGHYASPYTPGTAYVLLHHALGEVNGKRGQWGHALGGMGAITQAMAKACEARGVTIRTRAGVARVLVKAGRAAGVELDAGEVIEGRRVAANVNPRLLFQRLVDARTSTPTSSRASRPTPAAPATFRMNVALAELPHFSALPGGRRPHLRAASSWRPRWRTWSAPTSTRAPRLVARADRRAADPVGAG